MPEPKPAKLLVIDDEYVIRELLSEELGARGYQVFTAAHGEEAYPEDGLISVGSGAAHTAAGLPAGAT